MTNDLKSVHQVTGSGNYFEDFSVGQRIRHARGATVGEFENQFISKQVMNTAEAHWNEDSDSLAPMSGGRVVFGLVTASIVLGLSSQDVAENAIAELGCTGFRFASPVHHGDSLYAFTEVLETTSAQDRPDAGVVRLRHWGTTQTGQVVFEGERTILVKRRTHWSSSSDYGVET